MEVNLTPDTERKRLDLAATSGRGTDDLIEDAVAGYYDDVLQTRQHIEEGYLQAERGELIGGEQAQPPGGRPYSPGPRFGATIS
jgi:predicted transcriptional regulator